MRHADGRYETLAFPGASYVAPEDINGSGQIAGYFWDGTASRGFVATPSAVPEPGAGLLMLTGVAMLSGRRLLRLLRVLHPPPPHGSRCW